MLTLDQFLQDPEAGFNKGNRGDRLLLQNSQVRKEMAIAFGLGGQLMATREKRDESDHNDKNRRTPNHMDA